MPPFITWLLNGDLVGVEAGDKLEDDACLKLDLDDEEEDGVAISGKN